MNKIKHFSRKIVIFIATLLVFLSAQIAGITYSWLATNRNEINPGEFNGYLITDYFDSGDGSEENPFVITRPIHYFHMAELYQRNSEFAELGVVGNSYHFQIGKKFADADDPNAYYVYAYDNFGSQTNTVEHGKYSTSLNMAYYQGDLALLPIGTSHIPFNGELDGHGLEVSNLYIKSIETYTDSSGVEHIVKSSDIGAFGYIEGYNSATYTGGFVHDLFYNNLTIDLTGLDSSIISTNDFTHTVAHEDDKIYVGFIAGHMPCLGYDSDNGTIDVSGILQNVFVNNAKVVGYDTESFSGEPISNYGLIGYLDNLGDGTVPSLESAIKYVQSQAPTPIPSHGTGSGEDTGLGWGASLDMYALFHRMTRFAGYAYREEPVKTNFYLYSDGVNDYEGCYYFNIPEDPADASVVYLSGVCGTQNVPVEVKDGFFIERTIGETNNFMTIDFTTQEITNALDYESSTNFYFENHESYFYIYTEHNETVYYINCDADGNLSIDTEADTQWTYTQISEELDDGRPIDLRVSTTFNGNAFYITYYNNKWCAIELGSFYNIRYTETLEDNPDLETPIDVYMKRYGTNLIATTGSDIPTDFKRDLDDVDDSNPSLVGYKYYLTIGGIPYYISLDTHADNTIIPVLVDYEEIDSAVYLYEETGKGLFTLAGDGSRFYLRFNNVLGHWEFYSPRTYYLIVDDGHYLSLDEDFNLVAVDSDSLTKQSRWTIDENGWIYQEINGTTYYLHCDKTNNDVTDVTISTDTDARNIIRWQFEESGEFSSYVYLNVYIEKQETNYYLKYDVTNEEWILSKSGDYYRINSRVKDTDESYLDNYLLVQNDLSLVASSSEYSEFRKDDNSHMYIYINAIKYYLTVNTNTISDNDVYLTTNVAEAIEWIFEPTAGTRVEGTSDYTFTNMCVDKYGYKYYLIYEDSTWKVIRTGEYHLITDGEGSNLTYLRYNEGTFSGTTDRELATKFLTSSDHPQRYFVWEEIIINGAKTSVRSYLNCDNLHPIMSSSPTEWNFNSEDSLFYTSKSGMIYYLVYRGGEWIVLKTASYLEIKDKVDMSGTMTDVYFVATESTTGISLNQTEATKFEVHEANTSTNPEDIRRILSFDTADYTYYLKANTDTLDLSIVFDANDATEWYIKDPISANEYQSLYITIGDYQYKLTYNGTKWVLSNFGEYYMIVHNGKYMAIDNIDTTMDLVSTGDVSSSTKFIFNKTTEDYSILNGTTGETVLYSEGNISIVHNGVTYYLIRDSIGNLRMQHLEDASNATVWKTTEDHDILYTSVEYYTPETPAVLIDTLNYYVEYIAGVGWKLRLVDDFYTIKEEVDGDTFNYLSIDKVTHLISKTSDENQAIKFLLDNFNHLYTLFNEVPYFLNKTSSIALEVTDMPNTIWSFDDNNVAHTEYLGFSYYPTVIGNGWYCEIDKDYYTIKDTDTEVTFESGETYPVTSMKTRWYIEDAYDTDGGSIVGVYLYVVSRTNGKKYYLFNSNTNPDDNEALVLVEFEDESSSRTIFKLDETMIEVGDGEEMIIRGVYLFKGIYQFYIAYTGSSWRLKFVGDSYTIKDINSTTGQFAYMANDSTNVIGSESSKNWYFKVIDEATNSGYIQTIYNQTIYSLRRGRTGTMTLVTDESTATLFYVEHDTNDYTADPPALTEDFGTVYTYVSGVKQHLYYDFESATVSLNQWKTKEYEFFKLIKDDVGLGNYIASNGVSITRTNNPDEACRFNVEIISDTQGGQYYFYIDDRNNPGYRLYLASNNSDDYKLTFVSYSESYIGTKNTSLFRYDSSTGDLAYTYRGMTRYLKFDGTYWKFVLPSIAYVISDSYSGTELGLVYRSRRTYVSALPAGSNFTWDFDGMYFTTNFRNTTYSLSVTLSQNTYVLSAELLSQATFSIDNPDAMGNGTVSCTPFNSAISYNLCYEASSDSWILNPVNSLDITLDVNEYDFVSFEPDFENQTITYETNPWEPYKWYFTGPQTSANLIPYAEFSFATLDTLSEIRPFLNTAFNTLNTGYLYTFDDEGNRWYVCLGTHYPGYQQLALTDVLDSNVLQFLFGYYGDLDYDTEQYINPPDKTLLIVSPDSASDGGNHPISELRFEDNEWCMTPSCGQQPVYNLSRDRGTALANTSSSNPKISLIDSPKPISLHVTYFDENEIPDTEYIYHEVNPIQNSYKETENRPTSFMFDKIPNTFNTIIRLYEQGVPTNILNVINDDIEIPDNVLIYRQHYDPPENFGVSRHNEEIIAAYLAINTINPGQVDLVLVYNDYIDYIAADLTTYTPIITKLTDYIEDTELSSADSASTLNSGYIISGHNSGSAEESDITVAYQPHDSLVSPLGLSLNGINDTYSSDFDRIMEIITYDKETGEYVRITDVNPNHNTSHFSVNEDLLTSVPNTKLSSDLRLNGYENYANNDRARDKFAQTLAKDPTGVYGIQFRQAQISMDHIILAHNVSIKGMDFDLTKDNLYQMPEDCIDFNVYTQVVDGQEVNKGTVNFFAGTYYNGNEAFFSLHTIERDPLDGSIITNIREISKIYGPTGPDTSMMYIYEYVGGNTPILPDGYELVFDMEWLTNPTNVVNNAIYYFEIPVNAGEYALGSVYGKDGAYLMYLDVATMGASEVGGSIINPDDPSPMLQATPALVAAQAPLIEGIEYRDIVQITTIEDQEELNDPLKIFVGYDVPANATSDNFSIEIKYHKVVENDGYDEYVHQWCKGVYRIYIKNFTASVFDIDVLLVSPDNSQSYNYPYAFEFYMWNGTEYIVMSNNEVSYRPSDPSSEYVGYIGSLRRWSNTYHVHTSYIEPAVYTTE